jgi:hypothetical protein
MRARLPAPREHRPQERSGDIGIAIRAALDLELTGDRPADEPFPVIVLERPALLAERDERAALSRRQARPASEPVMVESPLQIDQPVVRAGRDSVDALACRLERPRHGRPLRRDTAERRAHECADRGCASPGSTPGRRRKARTRCRRPFQRSRARPAAARHRSGTRARARVGRPACARRDARPHQSDTSHQRRPSGRQMPVPSPPAQRYGGAIRCGTIG